MVDRQDKYINEIANHMLNNKLVPFIGEGFSKIFKNPSLGDILKDIIEEYALKKWLVETSLFSFAYQDEFNNAEAINESILDKLLDGDYLRLSGYIDYILKVKHGKSIHQVISDKILKYEDSREKNSEIEYIIKFFQLNKLLLEDIITTNYETNIEYCFNNEITVINRDIKNSNDSHYKNKVFKINGSISDINDEKSSGLMITENDCSNYRNRNKHLFYKIYSLFTEKNIVFIGYNISDPNIRNLLNNIIEENNGKTELQIYWVTKDNIKELDKQYYEEYFKIKIIQDMEIVDFFKILEEKTDKSLFPEEIAKVELSEYLKSLVYNYGEVAIEDVFKKDRVEIVIESLYNLLTEEVRGAIIPYFTILNRCEKEVINNNILYIQSIVEMQNRIILALFDLIDSKVEIKDFLRDNNLQEIAIDSLIRYTKDSHPFGEYADNIKYLLLAYDSFKEEIKVNSDEYINALFLNISMSCSDDPKCVGYDWRGLGTVEKHIHLLDEEDLLKLVEKFSDDNLNDMTMLQIEYVIKYADILDELRLELLYRKIYKKQLENSITRIIGQVMDTDLKEKYEFKKSEEGTYVLFNIKLAFNYESAYKEAAYTIEELVTKEPVIHVFQDFVDNQIEISINEETDRYENYSKFKADENELQSEIKSIIEAYIKYHIKL